MHYINYHESMQRGTLDFPVSFCHVTELHPQYQMPIHWHVEFEFIYVISGNLRLTIDEQEFDLSANSAAFLPSGALHSAVPLNECVYDCIVLDPKMLMTQSDACRKYILQIMNHELRIQSIYDENFDEERRIIWALFDAISSKKEGYQLTVPGTLYHFFGLVISRGYRSELSANSPRDLKRIIQLKRALEYIDANYASDITLQNMADHLKMSPKHFCRFFHEMTHRSPFDYLNYYRIERACYLLLTTNQSITDVAYNSGFNDTSYFIKIFKRYKETTPKQYRK